MSIPTQLRRPVPEAAGHAGAASPAESPYGRTWALAGVVALVPAAITLYLAFRTGGYYAEAYSGALLLFALGLGAVAIVSRHPFAGFSRPLMIAGAAMGLLAAWTRFSSEWSQAPQRALFESQRTALYLFVLLFFGTAFRQRGKLALAVGGVTAAIVAVCVAALATRLVPDVFTVPASMAAQRMSFPISYWNALGLFAAIGVVLLLHFTSDLRYPRAIRAAAAAAAPVTVLTLYFTFSRGAIGALALGLFVYLLIARSPGMVGAVLATAPTALIALVVAYRAGLLAEGNYSTSAAAASQGHRVAVVLLVACVAAGFLRLALSRVDSRVEALFPLSARARRLLVIGVAGAAMLCVAGAVLVNLPDRIERAYQSFTKPEGGVNARDHLREVSLDGRQAHWDVALQYFRAKPFTGDGAGTFETQWLRSRGAEGNTIQAHSLYLEAMAELGLPGLLLIVLAIGSILVGLLVRARGHRRPLYAALFAATLMWAVHAGVDWDWELPAVGIGLFALAAMALVEPVVPRERSGRPLASWVVRAAIVLGCVLVGVSAVRTVVADEAVGRAADALNAGQCRTAVREARSALRAVSTHPRPYEVIGWCELNANRPRAAAAAMREAARLDPTQWSYRYGLAIALAADGQNPGPALKRARELNPIGEFLSTGVAEKLLLPSNRARLKKLASSAARPGR